MPLPSASVDLVVSFETIEHLREQREMLAEFRRVLAADGVLVISSPNRPVYNEGGGIDNHYHVRELDRAELAALLTPALSAAGLVCAARARAVGAVGGTNECAAHRSS